MKTAIYTLRPGKTDDLKDKQRRPSTKGMPALTHDLNNAHDDQVGPQSTCGFNSTESINDIVLTTVNQVLPTPLPGAPNQSVRI